MKSIKLAIILVLALVAGCSFNASVSRGNDSRKISIERDDFRTVHNATVRIRAYIDGKLNWMGTGIVFKKASNRIHILTNEHVANGADSITAEFRVDGFSLGEYKCRVDFCTQETNIDVAVISLAHGETLASVPAIPMADKVLRKGDEAYFVGCDAGNVQNGQIARIVYSSDELFYMNPRAIGGDSGSGVVQFDNRGNPAIVGLIAWVGPFEGKQVAMCQPSRVIMGIIEGNIKPEIEIPPSLEKSDEVMQGLIQRLKNLRSDQQKDFKTLVQRLKELELKRAKQQEETQRFRDLFKKQQEESVEQGKGLQESILNQFNTLKLIIKWAKWSFYGLIGLLIAALFFKQGWATVVIVSVVTFAFRTGKLAYLVVHNAFVSKVKNPKTMSEALEDLQDGISEGIGRSEDDS